MMPTICYLNNAATSWPKAPGVADAMVATIQAPPIADGRVAGNHHQDNCPLGPVVGECRSLLAAKLNIDDRRLIALAFNASHALNLAIWGIGLTLPSGSQVITTVVEHNSVLRPLRHLQKWRDLRLTLIDLDCHGALDVEAFERALATDTSLVVFSHASNVTGRLYDVVPFFQRASAAGAVTLLDASQSIGHIPVHPHALHADMVAFPGHKGLLGPSGIGALYVSPDIAITSTFVGGTGDQSDLYYHPDELPTRLEAGTPNIPAIAGLSAALRWHKQNGADYCRREQAIASKLRAGLRKIPHVILFDDDQDGSYLPVVSFNIAGQSCGETGFRLREEYGVYCRTGLHCAPLMHQAIGSTPEGTVRFSVSGFTTEHEIDYVLKAIRIQAEEFAPRSAIYSLSGC